ncbi:hypothetical protein MKW98_006595 [Papaver atlanticum]|uniref:Legumain prodomain domain-containing protein n=1 Tax=Papaver atlanticum TaxID=357466 RepID=A0AAD4XQU2_9MAGN|nr:hypothetical protein MKW98_006595 [Papaver atlanticum]
MHVDRNIKLIGKLLFGFEKGPRVLEVVRPAGQPLIDDMYEMKHMRSVANICNAGIQKEQMAEAASQACVTIPKSSWISTHHVFSV